MPLYPRNWLNMIETYPRNLFQKKNQHRWKSQQIKRSKETKWRIVIVGDKLIEPRKVDPLQDCWKHDTRRHGNYRILLASLKLIDHQQSWIECSTQVGLIKKKITTILEQIRIYDFFLWLKWGNLNPTKPLESLNSSRKTAC